MGCGGSKERKKRLNKDIDKNKKLQGGFDFTSGKRKRRGLPQN